MPGLSRFFFFLPKTPGKSDFRDLASGESGRDHSKGLSANKSGCKTFFSEIWEFEVGNNVFKRAGQFFTKSLEQVVFEALELASLWRDYYGFAGKKIG